MSAGSIRDQIIAIFCEALGEPEISETNRGSMYYWTLKRGRYEVSMYVTIDSPEWPDMAHVLVSDSQQFQTDPVVSITVYTIEEARELVKRILKQWKQPAPTTPETPHSPDAT